MRIALTILLLIATTLAGCLGGTDDSDGVGPAPTAPSLEQRHPTGALLDPAIVADPATAAADLGLLVRLANATGTYFSIGAPTFEPTIGSTSSGALFMNRHVSVTGEGVGGGGQRIYRSTDQGLTWDDVTPRLPTGMKLIPNSNDPFIYVDPFTDRVYEFDMCVTLSGFCIAYSDDDGDTWTQQGVATGWTVALDHQSIAAAPDRSGYPMTLYENVLVFCVNRGVGSVGVWCSTSFTGGFDWTPMVPGYPVGTPQCWGLHGHIKGSPDGRFYRGNPSCAGPAVYRSDDGGLTWSEHTISTTLGLAPGFLLAHEIAVATDDDANVYAFWVAADGLPYLTVSTDAAQTWSEPLMVGAPGVTAAGFPAVEAGAPGRVAFAYIGTDVEDGYSGDTDAMNWTGYVGISLDFLSNRTIANVPVNTPDDPLDAERSCGNMRCGGFGDFISITIDPEGRPWAAMAHNAHDNAGIVGTLATGPSLRLDGDLAPLPLMGPLAWE